MEGLRHIGALMVLAGLGSLPGAVAASGNDPVPTVEPPQLLPGAADLSDCYPPGAAMMGREGRVVVTVMVHPDGTASDPEFGLGTEDWQRRAARCVVERLRFSPPTRDGVPVAARATVPIVLGIAGASGKVPAFDAPQLRSDAATVAAVQRDCYPAGATAAQAPVFRFTVGVDGRARNVKLLKSGGDPRLDAAGKCIVRKLEFKPLIRGSQAVRSSVSWTIPVGPPES